MQNEYDTDLINDDPLDEIMGEGEEGGGESVKARYLNQVGKTGRYIVGGFKELDDDQQEKLGPAELAKYRMGASLAERKKFKAVILYNPEDIGRALWPDGKVFQGKLPLCQSERSIAPYDVARQQSKMAPLDRQALKQLGHTGQCSTCKIGTDLCKVRNVAYLVDVDHFKAVNAYNAAHPEAEPLEHVFSKLDSKGPQSTWNFRKCYRDLKAQAKKEGKRLGDYIVEFSAEEGFQGTSKVTFRVVSVIPEDDPLRHVIKFLARMALDASKIERKPFTALNGKTEVPALPPGQVESADGVIIPDEIPF